VKTTAMRWTVVATLLLSAARARADDWPQWLGPKRDGVWRETGLLEKFPASGPKVRWRADVAHGYSGPAVAGGKVFLTDFVPGEGVQLPRSGFGRSRLKGKERILFLDEATGKQLWKHEYATLYTVSYPNGPRATPLVADGKVYTLGAMGDLLCLNTTDGKVIWSKSFPRDYKANPPGWGFVSHPLLDGDRLICLVGGEGTAVVAFDKDSGKEVWRSLSNDRTEIGYAPPMIYEVGGKRQLIIWLPDTVNSLDPATGKRYWSEKFFARSNLTIPTPRLAGDLLLVSAFYNGSLMLKLDRDKPAAEVLWKSKGRGERPGATEGLHAIMATPFIKDGYIYGVCSYGELRCLDARTGERKWMDLEATGSRERDEDRWANAFLVEQGDRFWLLNEKGDLIIAKLTPQKYEEISRAHILEPTDPMPGRRVVWSHPAFANKSMYARNDKEIVCVSLAQE